MRNLILYDTIGMGLDLKLYADFTMKDKIQFFFLCIPLFFFGIILVKRSDGYFHWLAFSRMGERILRKEDFKNFMEEV